jgi:hypothetical protein
MLNGAMGFQFVNVHFSGFQGDAISLWDCYGTIINTTTGGGTTTGRHIGIHRACYETQVIAANNRTYTLSPIIVYTEQYQVPSGPLLTLTPEYTKFVDTHCWTSAAPAQAIDLEGALNVNLTSCTFDGPATLYSTGTRYTAPTNNVLADTGASSGVVSVGVAAPVENTGTATNPVIAITPGTNGYVLTTTGGVVGWASPGASGVTAVTASSPLASSGGATPNITITSPLPVTNGGTGTATPSLVAGTNITVTGTWPNQTVNSTASGGGLPFAVVQETFYSQLANSTSFTFPFPKTATSGNTILIILAYDSTQTVTPSVAYTTGFTVTTPTYNGLKALLRVSNGTETSFTCAAFSTVDNFAAYMYEFSGSHSFDQHSTGTTANQNVYSAILPSITPTSGAMVFGAGCFIPANYCTSNVSSGGDKVIPISVMGIASARVLVGCVYAAASTGAATVPPTIGVSSAGYGTDGFAYASFSII